MNRNEQNQNISDEDELENYVRMSLPATYRDGERQIGPGLGPYGLQQECRGLHVLSGARLGAPPSGATPPVIKKRRLPAVTNERSVEAGFSSGC